MAAKKKATRKTARKATRKITAKPAAKSAAARAMRKKVAKRAGDISTVKKRKSAGRPPFVPTPEQRKNVETLAGLGLRHAEIVLLVENPTTGKPLGETALREHFSVELKRGAPKIHAQIAQSLVRKALGDGPQSVTAAIWYSKCRMGWKERTVVEVESKSGVLVAPASMTPDEWIKQATARTADKKEPGTE